MVLFQNVLLQGLLMTAVMPGSAHCGDDNIVSANDYISAAIALKLGTLPAVVLRGKMNCFFIELKAECSP